MIYNVTSGPYNASGDGSTDDTAAVQAAIDDAGVAGGVVYFPAGTYMVDPLNAGYSNVIYRGEGLASLLKLRPQNLSTLGDHAILQVWGTAMNRLKGVVVEYLNWSGNVSAHSGTAGPDMECVNFKYVDDPTSLMNYVEESISEGIDLDNCTRANIMFNRAFNCGGNGIHISENTTTAINIGNYAENCGFAFDRNGIDQYESAIDNLYVGNIMKDNNRNMKIINSGAVVGLNKLIGGANNTTMEGAISDRMNDRHADQNTNLFVEEQITQTGWKTKAGDGSNTMDISITFDTPFDDIKLARADMGPTLPTPSGVPATIKDATGGTSGPDGITSGVQNVTNSGMTVRLARANGVFSTNTRYGFIWEAKGIKRQT